MFLYRYQIFFFIGKTHPLKEITMLLLNLCCCCCCCLEFLRYRFTTSFRKSGGKNIFFSVVSCSVENRFIYKIWVPYQCQNLCFSVKVMCDVLKRFQLFCTLSKIFKCISFIQRVFSVHDGLWLEFNSKIISTSVRRCDIIHIFKKSYVSLFVAVLFGCVD